MKKTYLLEKRAMLDIVEALLDKLEYMTTDTAHDIERYTAELADMDPDQAKLNWRVNDIAVLKAKLTAADAVQKALEKLI